MTPVVRLTDVSKSFKGMTVLKDVNLAVEPGECVAIEGPNGSGKSVLLRLMCGLMRPDTGSVTFDPTFLPPGRTLPDSFGVIIDRPGYIAHLTGFENLQELARIRRVIGDDEIEDALVRVGLSPDIRQSVGRYSMGMKQKLGLAQAIMEDQRVLLLDEPFNALDASSVEAVRALLAELLAEGRTLVFTSHNAADIEALAGRRLRIDGHTLVA